MKNMNSVIDKGEQKMLRLWVEIKCQEIKCKDHFCRVILESKLMQ